MEQSSLNRRKPWSLAVRRVAAPLVLAVLAAGLVASGGLSTGATTAFAQDAEEAPPANAAQAAADALGDAAGNPDGTWEGLAKFATVIALIIVPMIVGNWLAKRLRMPDHGWKFALAIGSIAAAAVVVSTGEIKLGPDLSGGITLIYELQETSDLDAAPGDQDAGADGDAIAEGDDEAADDPQNAFAGMDRDDRMALLIKALMERVDPAGIKEVSIKKFGEGQIEIIIPQATQQELANIERRIYTAGALEFRITASEQFDSHMSIINLARDVPIGQDVVKQSGSGAVARWVPFDQGQFGDIDSAKNNYGLVTRMSGETPQALVMTDDGLDVTGGFLRRASATVDQTGNPAVSFTFNAIGAFKFGQLTGSHLPNSAGAHYNLGILLDNRLLSAPRLNSKITDQGIIEGNMDQEEVEFLAGVLNAGSLPAALNKDPISRAQISPTLGKLTVEKGKQALVISITLVAVFMAFYYRFAGFASWLGLAVNMLLIVGCMILIKAAFTLPGLAGLVLTIGMSVDANVLIYERIREELSRGAALRMAIRNGFSRATQTIIDSNLTNLITGVVIYKIAPDNVKGFGVTLVLGILMSVYTAVFLMRILFDVAERRQWITTLRMRQIIGETHYDFLKWRRVWISVSLVMIAIGITAVAMRGRDLLDIDFTGGSSVTVVLKEDQKMTFAEVNKLLRDDPAFADSGLSLVEMDQSNTRYTITTTNEHVEEVEAKLTKAFGDRLKTYSVNVTDVTPIGAGDSVGSAPNEHPLWLRDRLWGLPLSMSYVTLLQDAGAPADEEPAAPAEPSEAEQPGTDEATSPSAEAAEPDADADQPAETGADAETDSPEGAAANAFTGGTSAKFVFSGDDETGAVEGVSHETLSRLVSDSLKAAGHPDAAFRLSNPEYQPGSIRAFKEWEVRLALPPDEASAVFDSLRSGMNAEPVFPLSNKIGGRVAGRMAADAIFAVVLCLAGIIAYVWFRFHGVMYGIAAVVALVHDVTISLGVIALTSYFVEFADPLASLLMIDKFQINLTLVAALLTIIGYSLNDTIVIFDRIREVKGKSPRLTPEMINASVNQTLGRTILTSLTTLISTVVLYIIGGEGIHAFAFALLIGFNVGWYSTIFIASPVLMWLSDRFDTTAVKVPARAA